MEDFGKQHPQATVHDLRDALDAIPAGRPVPVPSIKSVSCMITQPQWGTYQTCRHRYFWIADGANRLAIYTHVQIRTSRQSFTRLARAVIAPVK
jgi:hypothetical protein